MPVAKNMENTASPESIPSAPLCSGQFIEPFDTAFRDRENGVNATTTPCTARVQRRPSCALGLDAQSETTASREHLFLQEADDHEACTRVAEVLESPVHPAEDEDDPESNAEQGVFLGLFCLSGVLGCAVMDESAAELSFLQVNDAPDFEAVHRIPSPPSSKLEAYTACRIAGYVKRVSDRHRETMQLRMLLYQIRPAIVVTNVHCDEVHLCHLQTDW